MEYYYEKKANQYSDPNGVELPGQKATYISKNQARIIPFPLFQIKEHQTEYLCTTK